MIEFKDVSPEKINRQKVVVNGDEIGEVWSTQFGFQCQLRCGSLLQAPGWMSMNGSGNTVQEAIQNAVSNARRDAAALAAEADFIAKLLELQS